MKKLFIWLLSFIFIISLFSGCSNNTPSSSQTSNQTSSNISSSQTDKNSSYNAYISSSENSGSSLSANSDNLSSDIQSSAINNKNSAAANKNSSKKDSAESTNNSTNITEQSPQSQAPAAPIAPTTSSQAPAPVEQPAEQTPATITVTLSVDCKTAVAQGNDIAKAISQNGIILSGKKITLDTGATVYDALKKSGLVIGANNSAMGTYVYSIQSLSEKACGSKSGWIYYVNGNYVNKSCSKYTLKDGDTISFRYTCDNGNDL